jgi:hypothetical protein
VLAPRGWEVPSEPIVGAVEVHRLMRRWLAALGHEEYAEDAVLA